MSLGSWGGELSGRSVGLRNIRKPGRKKLKRRRKYLSTDTHRKSRAKAADRTASPGESRSGRSGSRQRDRDGGLSAVTKALALVGLAIIALGAIFALNNQGGSSANRASNGAAGSSSSDAGLADRYAFQVGKPGPGEKAPPIKLPSTDGGTFDLSSLRGQTVLLYFQEGIICQPCWDQLKDIEAKRDEFKALGIDKVVSITGDPLPALKQKVGYEGLSAPVLSDPGLVASKTYEADQYGMMGGGANGHSFVLINEDGVIEWRADYGGDPDYTMYVPVPNLLADMRKGIQAGSR